MRFDLGMLFMRLFRLLLRFLVPERPSETLYRPVRIQPVHVPATTGQSESAAILRVPDHQPEAAVVGRCWVIDGDTIDISGTRIRLFGIDAPELDHPYGKTAKWALIRLCRDQEIRAVFHGSFSHDRTVATCYLSDGRDLSAEMVRLGLAVDWPKFSGGKYRHLELEGIRKKLWRCDARQKGRMPPRMPD